ncbi:MAG: hypothetical protein QW568_03925 [Candidatus Anstonellaceae archaeon]
MPEATGTLEESKRLYHSLEERLDEALDRFVSVSDTGKGFKRAMEKISEQIASAEKMKMQMTDLALNETIVLADKVESDLEEAEKIAIGAALAAREEEWAGELEAARSSFEKMGAYLKKMKAASEEGEGMELRGASLSFRKNAKLCRERLLKLEEIFASKKHSVYSELRTAKKRVQKLKEEVGAALEGIAKKRLRRKTEETIGEIADFFRKGGAGRIVIDHKHLTLTSKGRHHRMPFTQSVKFALEEMLPIEASPTRLGKGVLILGSYESDGSDTVLRLGERMVAGDTVIYKEKTYRL